MEHKGYRGTVMLFDDEAGIFHGEVVDTQDVITFQGKTGQEVIKAFKDSVDEYLAFCEEQGREPSKPFSGQFMTRTGPEVHRLCVSASKLQGYKSFNAWVVDTLKTAATHSFSGRTVTIERIEEEEVRK